MAPATDSLESSADYRAFCEERLQDPYPFLHRLRTEAPVHWCAPMQLWLISRYEDVSAASRDPRFSSDRRGMYSQPLPPKLKERVAPLLDHMSKWIQFTDDPDHARLRKLANQAFTPKVVADLRPQIGGLVEAFLDNLPRDRTVDLIEVFCGPLPATVICEIIGVPVGQRDKFRDATARLVRFSSRGGPELRAHAEDACAAVDELLALFRDVVEERRRTPTGDLLSALVTAEADGDRLSNDELYALCVFLFLAGHETTTHGIANGVLSFLRHPAQWAKLKSNVPAFVGPAVEEVLRYESPVRRGVRRTLVEVELRGQRIPAGSNVILMLDAANRDPAQFDSPDKFDLERQPNRHVAFGFGRHFCLGAVLARLELEMAFRAIAGRFPDLRLSSNEVSWRPGMAIRGMEKLPVIIPSSGS